MTTLYVIIGILIFFVVLLLVPFKISICFHDILQVKIRYLFFSYNLSSKSNNKKNKKEEKKDNKKSSKKNIFNSIKSFKHLFKIFSKPIKCLVKSVDIKLLNIYISISEENAYKTAINYGKTCSVLYPIISIILDNNKPKEYIIKIFPNFNETKTLVNVDFNFDITILNLLKCAFNAIYGFIMYYIKIKSKKGVKI